MAEDQIRPDQEEAALLAFDEAASSGQDIKTALRATVARFPASAALLADYALTHATVRTGLTADTDALEERVLRRADALLTERLAPAKAVKPRRVTVYGLFSALKAQGSDKNKIAESIGIGMSVLTKLDRRMLDISTIPRKVVDDLAAALDIAASEVWRYLNNQPTLSPNARYKSLQKPELRPRQELESFANAISTAVKANELSAADAESWRDAGPVGPLDGE